MAEKFAASVNAVHVHTSAKKNEGIDNLFETISTAILVKHRKNENTSNSIRYFSIYFSLH